MIQRLLTVTADQPGPGQMTEQDFEHKLDELDSILNDPDVRLEPSRVWMLLAEGSQHDIARTVTAGA
jgi:hypothetical protein